MNNFYNTIGITGRELKKALSDVKKQNNRVLKIMKLVNKPLTPSDVHVIYCDIYPPCPLTSIRRAITNLTDDNFLIKQDSQKQGRYGKLNNTWKINNTYKKELWQ